MPLSLNMDMNVFNVTKFLLTSVVLGSASGLVSPAIEKFRRAYELKTRSKVCIGCPSNSVLRRVGISSTWTSVLLCVLCYALVFTVECQIELTSASKVHPHESYERFLRRALAPWTRENWEVTRIVILHGLGMCGMYENRTFFAWKSVILEDPTNSSAPGALFCPRNATANNYQDNISKTKYTTIDELDAELSHFKKRWGANYSKPSNETASQNLDVPVRAVTLPLNASGRLHYVQGVEDFGAITRTGSVFIYPPGSKKYSKKKKQSEMLECYVVRYEHDGGFQDLLGCVGLSRDKRRMVWYKNEDLYGGDAQLRPIGISPWLPRNQRRQLMDRVFQSQPTTLQDFLFVQLLIRMVVEGDLSPRKEAKMETFAVWHTVDCNAQPTVEIWAVVLMFALIIGLIISVVVFRYAAHRMIPCEIVGEDNIVRVWSREKNTSGKRESGATWLRIEQIEDLQRVTASVYEPISARCNYSIPFGNL